MKWLNNLQSIGENKGAGSCPFCNSTKTDYGFVVDDSKTQMGHGAVWCNDCNKGFHISRIKVLDGMQIKDIPQNIEF